MKVTIFKDIFTQTEPLFQDVVVAINWIKNGDSKELVERIRVEENKEKRNIFKKQLPSICFSGRFSQRKANFLLEHSGLICLDIDDLDKEKISTFKEKISKDEYCYSVFVSPSGNGLKVIIKIPANKSMHKPCFLALEEYFKKSFDLEIDKSGKDVGRVCFASYDPDIYYNEDSETWDSIIEEKKIEKTVTEVDKIIEILQKWMDKTEIYQKGGRNKYLTKFIHALHRYGVDKNKVQGYCRYKFSDFPENELNSTIESIYRGNDFGSQSFTEEELKGVKTAVPIEKNSKSVVDFWIINDKGKVTIDSKQFLRFIEANGFGVFRYKSDPNKTYFVQSKNMIVDFVGVKDIKDCVLDYVLENAPEPIFDELQNKNRYFEGTYLNALQEIKVEQIKDKKDSMYFFFDNFYYEVTKEKISKKSYPSLEGKHIWKSQICKKKIEKLVEIKESDFNNFVLRASTNSDNWEGNNKIDRYKSVITSLGYGMHTFKKFSEAKLVYYCDDSLGELEGHAEGGTGKNLIQKCLEFARNVVYIDGKDFDKKSQFKFQNVDIETQIVVVDDYEGEIKELFTKVTGHFEIEKKGMTREILPFEESPKLFVSSNTSPKGVSNSYKRRLHTMEISPYYSESKSIQDEFGKDFFSCDWSQREWDELFSFIFYCSQEYLKSGIFNYESLNMEHKQLANNTNWSFVNFIDNNVDKVSGEWYNGDSFYQIYLSDLGTEKDRISKQKFLSFCKTYCKIFKKKYEKRGRYKDDSEIIFL